MNKRVKIGGVRMARCLPSNENMTNSAEKYIKDFIDSNFDESYILYHNYDVIGKEFDFLFVDPESFVYLIEVKGWRDSEIIKVHSKNRISYRDQNGNVKEYDYNPLKQAKDYKFNLINLVREKFDFDLKVVHLVCYPRISKNDFYNKELDKVCGENQTILKDDLINKETFLKKIYISGEQYKKDSDIITAEQIYSLRSIFETKEELKWNNENHIELINLRNVPIEIKKKSIYSILIYINNANNIDNDLYFKLIELWKKGCKVHLIANNDDVINDFRQVFNDNLGHLSKYEDFEVNNSTTSIFNLWMYRYNGCFVGENFVIYDGKYKEYTEELKKFDKETNFNFSQYMLEHSNVSEDIYVTAGAGSGKTYSMISRITYLIHQHKYKPEELYKKIYLITFTNDAANNMKDKLKKYFMNYYLLTANKQAFMYIEEVNKMQISTIHSLVKKIIQAFCSELGLGLNTKITNGVMEERRIVNKHIDDYIKERYEGKDVLDVFSYRTYKLTEVVCELLKKIDAKNVYLEDGYDFGEPSSKIEDFIKERLPLIQKELLDSSIEENSIRLSQIIIILKKLIKTPDVFLGKSFELDYLFVDEFQDTDDIQIELIKEFQTICGFNFFVVGDIKQCIYRFRGAKEAAFKRLTNGRTDCIKHELYKNYRTDKELLDTFHPIFQKWAIPGYLEYNDNDKLEGVKSINKDKDKLVKIEIKSEITEMDFIHVLKSEKQSLLDKYSKDNKSKKIAILVRTNSDIGRVKDWCDNNDLLIRADTKGNLYSLESTKDLYILLLALKNNRDPKCLFNIFETSYTIQKEDRSKMFNIRGNKDKLLEYFNKLEPIKNWDDYLARVKKQPIMKVIRELIFELKPWLIYASRFDANEQMERQIFYKRNLEQLLENIINEYSRDYVTINKLTESLGIKIFTGASYDIRESIVKSDNSKVSIECTTIHKSKGLEYDTVILPFCDKPLNQKSPYGLSEVMIENKKISYSIQGDNPFEDKNINKYNNRIKNEYFDDEFDEEKNHKLNEEIRILYVALTRAISKVIYFKNLAVNPKGKDKLTQNMIDIK